MAYLNLYSNSQVRSLISKFTEEKAAAIQQSNKLRQELVRDTHFSISNIIQKINLLYFFVIFRLW